MGRRFFIHATNVHQGGGRSLLTAIVNTLPTYLKSVVILDTRMPLLSGLRKNIQIRRVKPSILHRFFAERWLANNVEKEDVVLCFGNLPPLFKLRGHAVVFVQNRYLVENVVLDGFSLKTRLRLSVERLWLTFRMGNVDEFIVQTPSMKSLLEKKVKERIPVHVFPFTENHDEYARKVPKSTSSQEKDADFLYVASGEPHKNHRQLIEAWCILAEEGIFPLLILTVGEESFAELCVWMQKKVELHRLNIENTGNVHPDQVRQLYKGASALIYPSTCESFGLPLIEARQAGLPVLASELDYVRDAIDPEQTFNPESSVSIARAVKRFLGLEQLPLPLHGAGEFVADIMKRAK